MLTGTGEKTLALAMLSASPLDNKMLTTGQLPLMLLPLAAFPR